MSASMPTAARFKNRRSVTLMLGIETDLWLPPSQNIGLLPAMRNHYRLLSLIVSIRSIWELRKSIPEMTGFRSYELIARINRIISQARNQSHPPIASAAADIKIAFVEASRMSAKKLHRWSLVPKFLPIFPGVHLETKSNVTPDSRHGEPGTGESSKA
jgi:hypothetical protein